MKIWGKSDIGMVSKNNEDSFTIETLDELPGCAFVVVCDGMGGAAAGDIASAIAIKSVSCDLKQTLSRKMSESELKNCIDKAVKAANTRIWEEAQNNPDCAGMGTTLVLAVATQDLVVFGNVGDSRAYFLDESGITRITNDHSLVFEMIKRGELSPYQAQHHPSRNVITRALGAEASVLCDMFSIKPASGQFLLLCSDGLTNEVSEPELYYEIFEAGQPEKACDILIDIANSRGGHDNITLVLLAL